MSRARPSVHRPTLAEIVLTKLDEHAERLDKLGGRVEGLEKLQTESEIKRAQRAEDAKARADRNAFWIKTILGALGAMTAVAEFLRWLNLQLK